MPQEVLPDPRVPQVRDDCDCVWRVHAVFAPHVLDVCWSLSVLVLCAAPVPCRNNAQASRALRQRDSRERQWLVHIQSAQLLLE